MCVDGPGRLAGRTKTITTAMLCQRGKKPIPTGTRFEMSAVLLIAIAGLVGKVCPTGAATLTHTPTDSLYQRYFDAVAPEDRENFIKYHLDKALEQRIPNYRSHTPKDFEFTTFQDAQEPEDFAINLLDHFMSAFGLDEVHVFEFVALNVICFPSGWCFNPDDVGNICCPF